MSSTPPQSSPDLIWTEAGEPRSERFGDVYFSKDDGLAETEAVFLAGCGLPDAWAGRDSFTVAELGFGTGLNIAALLRLWDRTRPPGARLHIFSIEGYPLSRDEAARALSAWPELAGVSEALLAAWPRTTPGFHRIDLPAFSASIDIAIGDVDWALTNWSGPADAWFLDGFSPALNPGMWSPAVFDRIAALSAPGARVATFTVAGAVRRGLSERGFQVDKRPGHGRKRERLEARLPGSGAPPPLLARALPTVAVIGAGIAGAATARALTERGARVVLVEADRPGAGASGFPAALVTPRLDAGDTLIAGLHAQALERARALYETVPGAILAEGVVQLEQAPRDAIRFAKVAAQPLWAADAMLVLSPERASACAGEPVPAGLLMSDALAIQPAPVLDAWLARIERVAGEAVRLIPENGRWSLRDAGDAVLVVADAVVIATGWGAARLLPDLPLRPVRGQADWTEEASSPPLAWGGYVAPTPTGLLFGATHDRDDEATDVRPEDSRHNLDTLHRRLPDLARRIADAETRARAAVRATTPDRLPLCGPVTERDGVFVLTGLGSRGFCVAPLLGEHLAAVILGEPSPLPTTFAARLSPGRFDTGLRSDAVG